MSMRLISYIHSHSHRVQLVSVQKLAIYSCMYHCIIKASLVTCTLFLSIPRSLLIMMVVNVNETVDVWNDK